MEKTFLSAKDISAILGVSVSLSYQIITTLNKELTELGYCVVRGKVNRLYFEKRYYYTQTPA